MDYLTEENTHVWHSRHGQRKHFLGMCPELLLAAQFCIALRVFCTYQMCSHVGVYSLVQLAFL